jgi:exopolysaccharide production protein ExoQ
MTPRAFLLLIPCFAILSTLWSESVDDTAKYSLEFALTAGCGLLLSAAPRPKLVLWGMFGAFALYVAVALLSGQTVDVGNSGETAFSGLTDSKNLLADIAATGLLVSLACCVAGIEDRRWLWAAAALGAAALQIYTLVEARSAGAFMGFVVGAICFVFLLVFRHVQLAIRVLATVFAGLTAAVAIFAYGEVSGGLVAGGLSLSAKDPTLTGRTYLWQRAGDYIVANPLLGKGFGAFWLRGNPEAEGLWHYAGITSREGFNFHNTAIEILVHLGWVGLVIAIIVALAGIGILLRRMMVQPTLALCFWLSLTAYELFRTPIETVGVTPFYYSTVMVFVAFGMGLASRTAEPIALSQQPPKPYWSRALRPVPGRSGWVES